jgi:hypothetical protein
MAVKKNDCRLQTPREEEWWPSIHPQFCSRQQETATNKSKARNLTSDTPTSPSVFKAQACHAINIPEPLKTSFNQPSKD